MSLISHGNENISSCKTVSIATRVLVFKFHIGYVGFHYLSKSVVRECVIMVTNHTDTF